jgi:hypothetical protein
MHGPGCYVALQKIICCYANKRVVAGIWYTRLSPDHDAAIRRGSEKGTTMSKTASIGFTPSTTLFGPLMASIDRLLMTWARAALRNGDLPYFGL